MKSPFIDLPITKAEAYSEINEMYEEIKFQGPFLDSWETETATGGEEMEWQDEDLVDEEENELDLHEGEVDLEE